MDFHSVTLENEELLHFLSAFASEIVRDHYDPILGSTQNDYMLERFQSVGAMKEQISSGYRYYLVHNQSDYIGFIAFLPKGTKMYLSKFYIHKAYRKKGYGKKMLDFVVDIARGEALDGVLLNVNKYNDDSIATYEHLGFTIVGAEKNDIGNGYFMDDYVLEYAF